MANNEQKNALAEFKKYCALVTCSSKEQKQIETIEKEMFKSEIEQFELALKNNDLFNAKSILNSIKDLAYVDTKQYQKSKEELKSQEIDNKIKSIKINLKNDFYATAYQEAKWLNYDFGYGDDRIAAIRKKTTDKVINYNIKKEKKKEKNNFSLVLGAEVNTLPLNYTYIDPYSIGLDLFNFNNFSAGIYKKFNYKKKYSGDFPKKSDVIGLKFRMQNIAAVKIDYSNFTDITNFLFTAPDAQFLLDYSLFRFLHFAGGVGYPNLNNNAEPYYQVEAGLRFVGNYFSSQINFRNINYVGINFYIVHTGFFINLDFDRNFKRSEKQKIENQYK